jgi:hypothetical protein
MRHHLPVSHGREFGFANFFGKLVQQGNVDAQQVLQRSFDLAPRQPPPANSPQALILGDSVPPQPISRPAQECLPVFRSDFFRVGGRHFARFNSVANPHPGGQVARIGQVGPQRLEVQSSAGLFTLVTVPAVRAQESAVRSGE